MNNPYQKLWDRLTQLGMTKTAMREQSGISTVSLAKMSKGEEVSLETLSKICVALSCAISDITDSPSILQAAQSISGMASSIPLESEDQRRLVEFFSTYDGLDYRFLGDLRDVDNPPFRRADYISWATPKYGREKAREAARLFEQATTYAAGGFYSANRKCHEMLLSGVSVADKDGGPRKTVEFIDWEHPETNDFAVAVEVTVEAAQVRRPDLVVYVNGIALGIIELKRSSVSIEEGVRQMCDNQAENAIERFFVTASLLVAGNDSTGIRYATTKTPPKYYVKWREDNKADDSVSRRVRAVAAKRHSLLQRGIASLFFKARFLDLLHKGIAFDKGIKKVARSNQFFALKASEPFVERRENGIIWHTQGSGKSLTMTWLARLIREMNPDARILIVTDREELDSQIEGTFKGVQLDIRRTTSGADLLHVLNDTVPDIICSLVHKFGRRGGDATAEDYRQYLADLRRNIPADFSPKGQFFVFVDECHRTQSGELHRAMVDILGKNACFFGFTGTPLLKADKASNLVFGPFIHTYKINEAKEDGVVLDLMYESRTVPTEIRGQEHIDAYFDRMTRQLSDPARQKLKQRWVTIQNIHSSTDRIRWIAADIEADLNSIPRLMQGGTAMLVAPDILAACRYWREFHSMGVPCAVISSYDPNGAAAGAGGDTDDSIKADIYREMLTTEGYYSDQVDVFEKEMKRRFIEEPARMRLLIVVDKLLTGFDAPSCTYLYIDKKMQDHGLFQAVCRTNRLDGEEKPFGHIVDYQGLFEPLKDAMISYTENAFEGFSKEDIDGLLMDRNALAKKALDAAYERVMQIREGVRLPRATLDFIAFFCGTEDLEDREAIKRKEPLREKFYEAARAFLRAYAEISCNLLAAGYSDEEATRLMRLARNLPGEVRAVMEASGDAIDIKNFDSQMRRLIDNFVVSAPVEHVTLPEFLQKGTIFEWIDRLVENGILKDEEDAGQHIRRESAAEAIVGNIRAEIIGHMAEHPVWFEKISKLLSDLIRRYKEGQIQYLEYLKSLGEQYENTIHPERGYPAELENATQRRLYDELGDVNAAIRVYDEAEPFFAEGYQTDPRRAQLVKQAIFRVVKDRARTERLFEIIAAPEGRA